MPLSEVKCTRSNENNEKWNNMYNRLISYRQRYGNCLVPNPYKEDTKLAIWVRTQRNSYKNNKLSNDRIDKLKQIGFKFIVNRSPLWTYNMFNRLVSYKQKYGNCLVPTDYKEDKQLGNWVNRQRHYYKNNILSNDFIDKLKSIGFVFDDQGNSNSYSRKSKNVNYNNGNDIVVSDIIVPSTSTSTNSFSIISKETAAETPIVRPISRRVNKQKVVNDYECVHGGDEEFVVSVTKPAKMQQQKEEVEVEEMMDAHNEVDGAKANENDPKSVLQATAVIKETIKNPKSVLPATSITVETKTETTTATRNTNIVNDRKKDKWDEEITVADEYFYDELRCASPICSIVTGNNASSISSSNGEDNSIFSDAQEEEKLFVVSTTSSSATTSSNSNSWQLIAEESNAMTTMCNGNDSIFDDAEEDQDIRFGPFLM